MSVDEVTVERTPREGSLDHLTVRVVRRCYRLLHSKRVGLILILAMAVSALLGTLFVQASDGVRDDPAAYDAWLESIRPRYGGWTPVLSALGIFRVYSTWWFAVLTVLLAASIIACTVHRIPLLWRQAMHPRVHVSERFLDRGRHHATVESGLRAQPTVEHVRSTLRSRHFRVIDDSAASGGLYADRNRFGPWGTTIAHMGFVVILLGVFVTSRFGFEDQINVMVGTSREVGHDTGLVVTAESFSDTYDESGAPIDYVSELVLERNGEVIEAREVRVNTPLRYDGVKIHQASFGVAAGVRITDADGEVVFDDGAPLLWTSPDGANSIGRIDLPEHDLEVIVLTAASGQAGSSLEPGELQIEVYAADDTAGPESVEQVYQGEAVTVGDLTYRFEREHKYTGLMVRGDPGAVWVWLGAAMLTVGMTMTFGLPHRRLWVRVQPSGGGSVVRVASAEKADSRYERWFAGLVADLSPAGASTRPPHKPREKAAHDAS